MSLPFDEQRWADFARAWLTGRIRRAEVERELEAQLAERRVAITLMPDARAWLATKGYDPIYGARPLARVVQREVRDPLTDEILFGQLEQGGTVGGTRGLGARLPGGRDPAPGAAAAPSRTHVRRTR